MFARILGVVLPFSLIVPLTASAQSHFSSCHDRTGNNATLLIPATAIFDIGGENLSSGSEIAVLTSDRRCAGVATWRGEHAAITIWGDDTATAVKDGFVEEESISFAVWDAATSTRYDAFAYQLSVELRSALEPLTSRRRYAADGVYELLTLSVARPPVAPPLMTPSDGAADLLLAEHFSWSPIDAADRYVFQLATDSEFSSLVTERSDLALPEVGVEGLTPQTPYFWRVAASGPGGTGAWSAVYRFSTMSLPAVPAPLAPAAGAVVQPGSVTLTWEPAAHAAWYEVDVARDTMMTESIARVDSVASDRFEFVADEAPSTLFWRVRARNAVGTGPWTTVRSFAVVDASPQLAPDLLAPADAAEFLEQTVVLQWSHDPEAEGYRLWLYEEVGASGYETVLDTTVMGGETLEIDVPGPGAYAWRVRSFNDYGEGPWSSLRSFQIDRVSTSTERETPAHAFRLKANYPNPFGSFTEIPFELAESGPVQVDVFNLAGVQVARLIDQVMPEGKHSLRWDADAVPSGVYLCRLRAGGRNLTIMMTRIN